MGHVIDGDVEPTAGGHLLLGYANGNYDNDRSNNQCKSDGNRNERFCLLFPIRQNCIH